MEQSTQRNAALVEETHAATQALLDQARQQVEVVGRFKLDRGEDRAGAVQMVKKAVAHFAKVGAERALADFHLSEAGFVEGDLYLIVFDDQGVICAHGKEPTFRGRNDWSKTDADGRPMTQEMIRVATTRGLGWVEYRARNRRTGAVEPKSTYVERCGAYTVACGIYGGQRDTGPASPPLLESSAT
jgi:hypothetical protein